MSGLLRAVLLLSLLAAGLLACEDGSRVSEVEETFLWGEQGIRFAPPADERWERHRWQQGGQEGVSFQVRRAPAGRILVADYRSLHRRHSRIVVGGARKDFDPAPDGARLEEVVDRVLFDPSDMPGGEATVTSELSERTVGGEPALSLDYTWSDGEVLFVGREVYVLAGDSLFELSLLGQEEDLELFERLVATVDFPPPESSP